LQPFGQSLPWHCTQRAPSLVQNSFGAVQLAAQQTLRPLTPIRGSQLFETQSFACAQL
jgi:hypothetical protein